MGGSVVGIKFSKMQFLLREFTFLPSLTLLSTQSVCKSFCAQLPFVWKTELERRFVDDFLGPVHF